MMIDDVMLRSEVDDADLFCLLTDLTTRLRVQMVCNAVIQYCT